MVLSFDFVFIAATSEGHIGIGGVCADGVTILEPDVLVDKSQSDSTGRTITLLGYDDLRKFLLIGTFQLLALLFA